MNKIEQMHLDAIDFHTTVYHDVPNDVDALKAASKSAEITEKIAIEFAEWLIKELILSSYGKYLSHTHQELFQKFLKTKQ